MNALLRDVNAMTTQFLATNCYFMALKGLYHRRVFAVCLQIDPDSYVWFCQRDKQT